MATCRRGSRCTAISPSTATEPTLDERHLLRFVGCRSDSSFHHQRHVRHFRFGIRIYFSAALELSSSSLGYIYGLVSQQGIFIGSATESYFDLFIAAPVASPAATRPPSKARTGWRTWISVLVGFGAPYRRRTTTQLHVSVESRWRGQPRAVSRSPDIIGGRRAPHYANRCRGEIHVSERRRSAPAAQPVERHVDCRDEVSVHLAGRQFCFRRISRRGGTCLWECARARARPRFRDCTTRPESIRTLRRCRPPCGYATQDTYYGALSALGGPVVEHQRRFTIAPSTMRSQRRWVHV